MGLQLYFHADYIAWMVAGLVDLAVAVWLLRIDPRNRVIQYFLAWLAVGGLAGSVLRFFYVETGGTLLPIWRVVDTWQAVAIATFGAAYLLATSGRRLPRWLPLPFVAVVVVSTIAASVRPEWFASAPVDDPSAVKTGPWWNLEEVAEMTVTAVLALLLAVRYARTGATRSHDLLAAGGLVAWVAVWQMPFFIWVLDSLQAPVALGARAWAGDWHTDLRHLSLFVQLPIILATGIVAAYGSQEARVRRAGRYLLIWILILFVFGAVRYLLIVGASEGSVLHATGVALAGVVSIGAPIAVALMLVKDEHLGVEARIERSFGRVAVASGLVFAFFLVSEMAEGWVESTSGSALAGLVAAGMMALASRPMHRLGRRLARADTDAPVSPEEAYRRQVRFAMADGQGIDGRERKRLDELAMALGLSGRKKTDIERDTVDG